MACGLIYLEYLKSKGCFNEEKYKILDIGSQNLLGAEFNKLYSFINSLPGGKSFKRDKIISLAERATIGSGIETTFLSEVFEDTMIQYDSLDIAPGKKTTIFDLNTDSVSPEIRGKYNLVLNFGTTEHVFNQYNAFKVIHEAAGKNAFIFHQLPAVGYLGHCYFLYTRKFFEDLAKANNYKILDMWLTGPQGFDNASSEMGELTMERKSTQDVNCQGWSSSYIPNGVLNCLYLKEITSEFKVRLEYNTSHSNVDLNILMKYSEKKKHQKSLLKGIIRLISGIKYLDK